MGDTLNRHAATRLGPEGRTAGLETPPSLV
jgi:hypothetical protein